MSTQTPSALETIQDAYDDLYDHMRYGNDKSLEFAQQRLVRSVVLAETYYTEEPWLSEYKSLRDMLGSVGIHDLSRHNDGLEL